MRVLIYDIETSYNILKAFQLLNKNMIPFGGIIQERNILTAAWKWKGGKVQSIAVKSSDPTDDKRIVETLYELFSQADEIVAHYGDKFDARYIRTRGLFHGLPPYPPVKQIDTYKIAKSRFLLNSNKLDYIGKFLGIGRKIKTDPGLWDACMDGKASAIRDMRRYNEQDVDLLDLVHDRLAQYAATTYVLMKDKQCHYCGGFLLQSRGRVRNRNQWFRRFQCQTCGKWGRMKDG